MIAVMRPWSTCVFTMSVKGCRHPNQGGADDHLGCEDTKKSGALPDPLDTEDFAPFTSAWV